MEDIDNAVKLTRDNTRTVSKEWIEENIPEGSKIAYEFFSPQLSVYPKRRFELMDLGKGYIVDNDYQFYVNQSVEYIIISDHMKKRDYEEPEKYSLQISRYEELAKKARLIQLFDNADNPGPIIEIYRLQ
ncbi:MAG: hypothetical protein HGA85_09015 [Nanoarchaeota archaeon]|nr:hypothetical protein [Nanoarchaeota archaeon]